ncbi:unnamed protein product [Rotaria magnacalcarata]|uniref:Calcineurin-like phosphoesterase domain-containing protein n=1 Tax=Rotaria magnacalcarata TaxID=392030 RepID=A0A816LLW6_9BILA|nr:unnamed protein product [Rotaria magnacalcarata]CAF1654496.1 unnamed protein product [Rotaria magnacalcarata]CAF1944119.1 unnamed protein product [Rotaria magnacalcarata]CAF4011426.1 unnamed protein product [Rotaria magnacalcarata]CAF4019803.1 unnamed protein product [Rotaria magnacalcarata]
MDNQTAKKVPESKAKAIIQTMLMSDLHLEFGNVIPPEFSAVAPVLILAGDIERPDVPSLQTFLLTLCQRFEHIFFVTGNHCFYQGEYEGRLQQLPELDKLNSRIHFLHNKSYRLRNSVRILGTTLWTYVPRESASKIGRCLNDYSLISIRVEKKDGKSTRKRRITVEDTNEWHAQQLAWLREKMEKARNNGEHVVIITHHAPCRHHTCSIEDEESGLMDAFVNDHDTDCVDPVRLWVYGHTHRSTDLTVSSTRIVSNQRGYVHENCRFRPNMKITLYDDRTIDVIDSVHCDS